VKAQIDMTRAPAKDLGKESSNWLMVELMGLLNRGKRAVLPEGAVPAIPITSSPVSPKALAELLVLKRKGEISGPTAKAVLEEMFETGKSAEDIVNTKGLTQVSDEAVLERIVEEVIAKNPAQLGQYRSGKEAVFGFLVGQVMKASGGKANPTKVNELLKRKLAQ
jgi:aspartyl-tRNA(Asn)/glutamyl-tRNA(Gln) amidotransferase subunit B